RLPRGVDQRQWRAAAADAAAMATRLIESIDDAVPAPGWRVPQDWIGGVDAALARHDPHTVLELQTACPGCDGVNSVACGLEGAILRELRAAQRRLIDDVHGLAAAYHWSEASICSLPPWRRRAYLARIERERAR